MKEIVIDRNETGQRLDRFLRKYLANASRGFIYKMIRKKNVKVNKKKVEPETILQEGDRVQLYLADETINKFKSKIEVRQSELPLEIIYEDDNIILMNKAVGILSHGAGGDFKENIVDGMISHLIRNGSYLPKLEKTFIPSICNRLDRNTSGIIIGAKNYQSLKVINEALRFSKIGRFYKTIVGGQLENDLEAKGYLIKDQDRNIVKISDMDIGGSKQIITNITTTASVGDYSLLEIELISGRPHQIRSHLSHLGYPVIGDRKYGDSLINKKFQNKYGLNNQWLHGYKIKFEGLGSPLGYLNKKVFESRPSEEYIRIESDLFSTYKGD